MRAEKLLATHGGTGRANKITSDDLENSRSHNVILNPVTLADLGINPNIAAAGVKLLALSPHVSTLHTWRRNRNCVFHGIGEVVSPRTIATLPPVGGEVGGWGGMARYLEKIPVRNDTDEPLHTHTAFLS
jgi:hypothetical protein